ncbi:MAG TPA: 50S ribosomal protein L6 [Candidatus Limnocylindrales bacterium]|nr:50S ribosomal protein L6 [Candidatus Limnocylindrales bacterium]
MSRLGKVPLVVPKGVTLKVEGDELVAKGPLGELRVKTDPAVPLTIGPDSILVGRNSESRHDRSRQGLIRRMVSNAIAGVSTGFTRTLEITGVGYRADARGTDLHLTLGYSHPIVYQLPPGVKASVEKMTSITVSGANRQLVGEVAAGIRKLRPPEPYKGKGVRYGNETIQRKAGKAGAAGK